MLNPKYKFGREWPTRDQNKFKREKWKPQPPKQEIPIRDMLIDLKLMTAWAKADYPITMTEDSRVILTELMLIYGRDAPDAILIYGLGLADIYKSDPKMRNLIDIWLKNHYADMSLQEFINRAS